METVGVSSNRRLALNLTANFVSYFITFGISFFLSPYIVRHVGVDAYGFVGLANNFVSYAALSTVALNALAGRFITVKIYENDRDGANRYFTSVFAANAAIAAVLLLVMSVIWIYLDALINIPASLLVDVKILFAALFLECVITTVGSVFSVATFATDRLYLNSLRTIESSIGRAVVLIVLFVFFAPNVCYLGITAVLMAVYCLFFNIYYTRKLLPDVKIRKEHFDIGAVWELMVSGVWALVIRLGQILSDGLDLLISNLMIDPIAMGILSLAKTIPMLISSVVGSIVGVFSPRFTILYAQKRSDELFAEVKRAMKIMGIIVNIPIIILVVCGKDFFALWQPTQDAKQLQILSILTCGCLMFSGGINCLYDLFIVVNRIKENAIAVVSGGLISILITFILLNTTNLGIYAIAATSTVVSIIRNVAFTAPFGAKCLGKKWYAFYPEVFRPVLYDLLSIGVSALMVLPLAAKGWLMLVVKACVVVAVALVFGFLVILNRSDRAMLKGMLTKFRGKFRTGRK